MDIDFGIFRCLNGEEQVAFGEYLDRVIAALEERLGDEPDAEEPDNDDMGETRHRGLRYGPRDLLPPHGLHPRPHVPRPREPRSHVPRPHEP